MKASHRTALSLLLTIIIFTVISLVAVFGGFRYVEMHYYQPRVVNNVMRILDSIGSYYDSYTDAMVKSFAAYAMDERSRSFIERDVTETDMEERERMTGELMEKNPGLDGIRLIEDDGNHIHYSTYPGDVLSKSDELISFRNYSDLNEIPVGFISVTDNGEYSKSIDELAARVGIYLDSVRERIIFSLPYFDKYTAHRGSLVFYVEPTEFVRQIVAENLVPLNTRLKIVSDVSEEANTQTSGNSGFVFGMPNVGRDMLSKSILKNWSSRRYGSEPIVQTDSDDILILVTGTKCRYGKIGWICHESDFLFSETEKVLLLLCLFITLFLIIFILFNFRHDDSVIIRERVHKFEMALFREYLEHRDTADWKALEKQVAMRKQDVNAEIVKSLGITGKKHSKEISEALDRSWNDFMHLVSGGYRATLENLTSHQETSEISGPSHAAVDSGLDDDLDELEEVEEVETLESADGPEGELEELSEIDDAENVEELEEIPDAEADVKSIPKGSDDIENDDVEELEELPESDDDLGIPLIDDFVDPLADDKSPVEAEPLDLEELSPEEEAQLSRGAVQEKKSATWRDGFLSDDEIGTPRFDDLDDEDESFWKEK